MATRKIKLSGIGYWAKVFESNRDLTGFEDALKDVGGQCTIDVDLDAENMAKLKASKSMKKGNPSPDNPGMTRVKFTRKWEEQYGGGAPTVVKDDSTIWDYDEDGTIGNGSSVDVLLAVYDTSRKSIVGTRLDKIKVTKHIPYVSDDDGPVDDDSDDVEDEDIEVVVAAPKAKKVAAKASTTMDIEDDNIPF